MTNPEPKLNPAEDAVIEAEATGEPRVAADEQFVHGLLQFLHQDTKVHQEQRIARVMMEIRRGRLRSSHINFSATRRAILAAAACIVLVATIAYLGIPTGQSAHAMVQASIDASKSAGPRRYEVRAELPTRGDRQRPDDGADVQTTLQRIALIDIQNSQHVLIRAVTPRGHVLVVGRNEVGEWAVRPDGSIERFDAQRAWPRWIELNGESILFESVDALLEQLEPNYALKRLDAEPEAEFPARTFERIIARKRGGPGHLPQGIGLWINPDTRIVQRMELRWNVDGERQERKPSQSRGPRVRRPANSGEPEMSVSDGLAPQTTADRPRRSQPNSDHDDGPKHAGAPCFLDGPPRFREGGHRPPPRIVFRLIDAPEFEDDWFDPETHAR